MLADVIVKVAGMEKQKRGKWKVRLSQSGPEFCMRQHVYWARGFPEDSAISDRFMMTIDDSSWHETLTGDWIQKSAFKLHSEQMEVEVTFNDITAKGHIDGIITDILLKDYLYEHKALNHFAFNRYWKGEYPLNYICQCCSYLRGLHTINPDIDQAILLIKNKNTAQFIDYLIEYDYETDTAHILEVTHSNGQKKTSTPYLLTIENIVSDVFKRFDNILEHIKNKTLPDRPYEIGTDFPCGYCSWENTCWRDYEKDYQALAENAALDDEIADLAKYYLETNMHIKNMEDEKNTLRGKILNILHDKGVKKGRAREYTLQIQLRPFTRIDQEKIPVDILEKAKKISYSEILTIRKPKKEES